MLCVLTLIDLDHADAKDYMAMFSANSWAFTVSQLLFYSFMSMDIDLIKQTSIMNIDFSFPFVSAS